MGKRYDGIDLFKLIASVLIIILHAVETTDFAACAVKWVCTRFAVPFFFIAAGFFFYLGLERSSDKKEYFIKYEKRLLIYFFVWAVVLYAPVTIGTYLAEYQGAGIITIVLVWIRRVFVIGPGPYWYLLAQILTTVVLYWCYRCGKDWLLVVLSVVGLLLAVLYSCFREALSGIAFFRTLFDLIYFVFSWEFNFIMYGIPFCGIGYLIAKRNLDLDMNKAIWLFVVATVLRVVEYYIPVLFSGTSFWESNNISLAFIAQAAGYFFIAKNLRLELRYAADIRKLSTFIYFSHAIVLYNILNPLLAELLPFNIYQPAFIPVKVLIVAVICTALYAGIKRINNKYLNILIGG